MGPHHLPSVGHPSRLEPPSQHPGVEVAEARGIGHQVGDVRQLTGPGAVEFRALSAGRRLEDREGHALRVGGVEQHAVIGAPDLARDATRLRDRRAGGLHVGDGVAAEQGGRSRVLPNPGWQFGVGDPMRRLKTLTVLAVGFVLLIA